MGKWFKGLKYVLVVEPVPSKLQGDLEAEPCDGPDHWTGFGSTSRSKRLTGKTVQSAASLCKRSANISQSVWHWYERVRLVCVGLSRRRHIYDYKNMTHPLPFTRLVVENLIFSSWASTFQLPNSFISGPEVFEHFVLLCVCMKEQQTERRSLQSGWTLTYHQGKQTSSCAAPVNPSLWPHCSYLVSIRRKSQ